MEQGIIKHENMSFEGEFDNHCARILNKLQIPVAFGEVILLNPPNTWREI